MTNAEARFNNSLRPRKPEGSLGRTAQDVHLDSHTAPEQCKIHSTENRCIIGPENIIFAGASVHLSARKFDRLGQ